MKRPARVVAPGLEWATLVCALAGVIAAIIGTEPSRWATALWALIMAAWAIAARSWRKASEKWERVAQSWRETAQLLSDSRR